MTRMSLPAPKRPVDRLVVAGLVGAVILTMTWWTLIAYGLWSAVG